MTAISNDLRERIVHAVESGPYTQAEVSDLYEVSLSFVEKLWHRYRVAGTVADTPRQSPPGRRRVLAPYATWIRQTVRTQPDVTLQELCDQIDAAHGVRATPSMMCRELARLDLRRKKSPSTTASATHLG